MSQPRGPIPPAYDPERLAAEAKASGWAYERRKLDFAMAMIGLICWVVLLWFLRPWPKSRVLFARWSRHQMIRQGAVFIKLGQMLSTRVDAFSEEVLAELSQLQDKVPSFPFAAVRSIVEADLGKSLDVLYTSFDPEPLAAASLGQVHAARLVDGSDVAVKILRPGLQERFAIDITLLRYVAGEMHRWPRTIIRLGGSPKTPWVGLIDRLGVSLYQQLDLWVEGLHGEKFARNFAADARVSSPAIHWSHSSTRVLTQERIYGYRFDDEAAIRAAGIDYIEMAEVGIRAFTKQVFEDAFFHADTHPGNIFVTDDKRLIYLDFGMVEYIDEQFQADLVEMFIHIIQQDWAAFLEDMVRSDIVPAEVDRKELLPIFTDVFAAQLGFTDRRYTLQDVSDRFYGIMQRYPFRLPERFLFLTRTSSTMEGVVYRADPSFKFLPIALPFFAKLVLEKIDVEDPWILQDLLAVANKGDMVERLGSLVNMALADQPEAAGALAEKLIEVVGHPKAAPLRTELANRLLDGQVDSLSAMIPQPFTPTPALLDRLMTFLVSDAGRDWGITMLEDPRFPAFAAKYVGAASTPLDWPLDWGRILKAWFPAGEGRQRGIQALQGLLANPDFPWSTLVDPLQGIHQLESLRRHHAIVPQSLPALLDFLRQRDTLPLLARGVIRGMSQNLGLMPRNGHTGPIRGTQPLSPAEVPNHE